MNKGDLIAIHRANDKGGGHTLWSCGRGKTTYTDPVPGRLYEVADPAATSPAGYRKWKTCVKLVDPMTGETYYTRTVSAFVVATVQDVDDYMA